MCAIEHGYCANNVLSKRVQNLSRVWKKKLGNGFLKKKKKEKKIRNEQECSVVITVYIKA